MIKKNNHKNKKRRIDGILKIIGILGFKMIPIPIPKRIKKINENVKLIKGIKDSRQKNNTTLIKTPLTFVKCFAMFWENSIAYFTPSDPVVSINNGRTTKMNPLNNMYSFLPARPLKSLIQFTIC